MISPTIGRKVWYWPAPSAHPDMRQHDKGVPLDATVIYPWSDSFVNLHVIDHAGMSYTVTSALLHQGSVDDRPRDVSCATWMPYQQGQAKAPPTSSPSRSPDISGAIF